jgi:hypothetical protein
MPVDIKLNALRQKVATYGKENQGELLYALAEGAQLLSGSERIRIYLEDLTRGALSCVLATGPFATEVSGSTFPLVSAEMVVSNVFVGQYPTDFRTSAGSEAPDTDFARRFGFRASYVMPIVSLGKSIGVLCIDQDHPGDVLGGKAKSKLADFAGYLADYLDNARI